MIELRGETRTYQLDCASTNALCRLEELTGRPHEKVMAELRGTKANTRTVRAFIAASLVEPVDDVGPVLADIGGVAVIRKAVRMAFGPARKKGRHG